MEEYLEFRDLSESSDGSLDHSERQERRENLRLNEAFPAKVRGMDAGGRIIESDTVVKNISVKGFYLQLKQRVDPGARLFVVVQFSKASANWGVGARVAIHGLVLRSEPKPVSGEYGVAVATIHHRFL